MSDIKGEPREDIDIAVALQTAIQVTGDVLGEPGRRNEMLAWAEGYLESLRSAGAGNDIDALLAFGCKRFPLAATLGLSTWLAAVPETNFASFSESRRANLIRELNATATILESLDRELSLSTIWKLAPGLPLPPVNTAATLRTYALLIGIGPLLRDTLHVKGTRDIERYGPTAYVRHATGGWHDAQVSALIAAATGKELDENTHRNWRNRSFDRITIRFDVLWRIAELLV